MIAREKALVRLANKASTDLTGKEEFVSEYDSGLKLSGGTNALGIIVEGGASETDIAILGTFDGIVRVKASAAITLGSKVVVDSAGKVKDLPATAGTYTVIGVAVQGGSADELVEIAPMKPESVTISAG